MSLDHKITISHFTVIISVCEDLNVCFFFLTFLKSFLLINFLSALTKPL